MGFVRKIANSAAGTAYVFVFLYLAYEINRSLFLTGLDVITSTFSKDDDSVTEDSETEE